MISAKYKQAFTKGLIKENPVLRLVLGTCPTLAVTTAAINGIGMGAAATFVLVCSNVVISLLRKVIPDRCACRRLSLLSRALPLLSDAGQSIPPAIDKALGIYLPLIVVNCIILRRAEAYASKTASVFRAGCVSAWGGLHRALILMGGIRELSATAPFRSAGRRNTCPPDHDFCNARGRILRLRHTDMAGKPAVRPF